MPEMADIVTPRLVLRLPQADDAEPLMEIHQDPYAVKYIVFGTTPGGLTAAWRNVAMMLGHWQLRGYGQWTVVEKTSGEVIGRVGLWHPEGWPGIELGWIIRRSRWNHGFATEAARAALDWTWQRVGTDRVISLIQPDNAPSIRVAEKIGERFERHDSMNGSEVLVYGVRRHATTGDEEPDPGYRGPETGDRRPKTDDQRPMAAIPAAVTIRPASEADFEEMWPIFRAIVDAGETYAFAADTPYADACAYFFGPDIRTHVAEADGRIVGFYKLIANRLDRGDHVANASFMVAPWFSGRGVGRQLGVHCLREAKRAGFQAMQFNFVVSTNTVGVELWKHLGFAIVGTLPKVFRHRTLGDVDAYVMYRSLDTVEGVPDER